MNHSTPDSPTYEALKISMRGEYPSTWLITGVAGFIGSNLLQELLQLDQQVVGLDNFATGHQRNLDEVQELVTPAQWSNFQFIKGDIRELADCHQACEGVDYVLHQAALGSVPRSLADPITTNAANITGFLNMLQAARAANGGVGTKSFVYAASSSTYGDHPGLPKVEELIGRPLSPYAVTKYVNELYAQIYSRCYGFNSIGLRYFNVFGPRQDPNGAYAAVIPKWIHSLLNGEVVFINGDGETSRDFTYVENVVQANILAAKSTSIAQNEIYNLAAGEQTSLNQLFDLICKNLQTYKLISTSRPEHKDFRSGDVRHSLADISKAKRLLNYHPAIRVESGIFETIRWHLKTRC